MVFSLSLLIIQLLTIHWTYFLGNQKAVLQKYLITMPSDLQRRMDFTDVFPDLEIKVLEPTSRSILAIRTILGLTMPIQMVWLSYKLPRCGLEVQIQSYLEKSHQSLIASLILIFILAGVLILGPRYLNLCHREWQGSMWCLGLGIWNYFDPKKIYECFEKAYDILWEILYYVLDYQGIFDPLPRSWQFKILSLPQILADQKKLSLLSLVLALISLKLLWLGLLMQILCFFVTWPAHHNPTVLEVYNNSLCQRDHRFDDNEERKLLSMYISYFVWAERLGKDLWVPRPKTNRDEYFLNLQHKELWLDLEHEEYFIWIEKQLNHEQI